MNTIETLNQSLTNNAIIELLGIDKIKELYNSSKTPAKPKTVRQINRAGFNKSIEKKLQSFDNVYNTIKKDDFNLSNRVSKSSIEVNKGRIISKLLGLSSDSKIELLNELKISNLDRLTTLLTNRNLFIHVLLTPRQKEQIGNRKFTATFIIDRIITGLTMKESSYNKLIEGYKEKVRINKLKAKYNS